MGLVSPKIFYTLPSDVINGTTIQNLISKLANSMNRTAREFLT